MYWQEWRRRKNRTAVHSEIRAIGCTNKSLNENALQAAPVKFHGKPPLLQARITTDASLLPRFHHGAAWHGIAIVDLLHALRWREKLSSSHHLRINAFLARGKVSAFR